MFFPIKIGTSTYLKIRGVIASRNIKRGETIEVCPMIIIKRIFNKFIDKTPLEYYYFEWDRQNICILQGYGSLYNHSYHANSEFDEDHKNNLMILKAIKDIKKNEEITINYNGYADLQTPLEENYLSFDKHFPK